MDNEIKLGDSVQLKSGGTKMTITAMSEDNGVMMAHCEWNDKNDKPQAQSYPLVGLKKYSARPKTRRMDRG
jgi:uncharacterized protein YodC (DUF2158 family)